MEKGYVLDHGHAVVVPEKAEGETAMDTVTNTWEFVDFTGEKVWVDGGKTHDNAQEVSLSVLSQKDGRWTALSNTPSWLGNAFVF